MKTPKLFIGIFILGALSAVTAYSQQEFVHIVTAQNKYCNSTCSLLNVPELTNNPAAIIIVTPILVNGVNPNPHPVGVYYAEPKKWSIVNVDGTAIVEGSKFNVQFYAQPSSDQFVYLIPNGIACIDRPGLNDNPKAKVKFSATGAPTGALFNRKEVKIEYDASVLQWCLQNIDKSPMRYNTAFNVVIFPEPAENTDNPSMRVSPTTPVPTRTRMPVTAPTAQPVLDAPPISPPPTTEASGAAKKPCREADAGQKIGHWDKQHQDSLANADPTFPEAQYRQVLMKAQKAIELLKKATPQPIGFQPFAYRSIGNHSYTPGGALKFWVTAMYMGYLCIPDQPDVSGRGLIVPSNGTQTVIEVTFNSLGRILTVEQQGLAVDNQIILSSPKEIGELKGLPLFTSVGDRPKEDEAVIIASGERLPLSPVSREQFIRALITNSKNRIKAAQTKKSANSAGEVKTEEEEIAKFDAMIARMSVNERQTQAIVGSFSGSQGKYFVSKSDNSARHLVTIDKSFFDPKLPRQTIQFITVYWRWNEKDPQEAELIRQFKQNFDFDALRQMVGK